MNEPVAAPGRVECLRWILAARGDPCDVDEAAPDEWLLAHDLAAVPVANPAGFELQGPFLARYERCWTVKFGVTAGIVFDPCGAADGATLEAQVLVSLALDADARSSRPPSASGKVAAIALAEAAGEPMIPLQRGFAEAGAGLRGDRYARGAGTFSNSSSTGGDLTLIESEALGELAKRGVDLNPLEARRNIVTEGIDLDRLIGRRFRVGPVECIGRRRCEPCAVLERLTKPGVLRGLVHRGGLRADVVSSGEISVGDEIAPVD